MDRQTFAWGRSKNRILPDDHWVERLWLVVLLLAAVLLFGINLGGLPLRDWDEGTVAQVAREIFQAPAGSWRWLYPTLGNESYFNKPPLVHLLIAGVYKLGGVNEWTTRLPGAMLTALSVPLLYGIGRELFRQRLPALLAALIYLTLLPLVRHGRLAMLDGPVLCFFLLMMWSVLRSRRDLRWALGTGIGFGLICLTKGMMGLLLGAIALCFLAWDTPRLLTSGYAWMGLVIGSTPVAAWYAAQLIQHQEEFIQVGIFNQSLQRIWTPVENHGGYSWYYLLEIVKYNWPWLLFWPQGLRLAWENRNLSWAKLVLVWTGVYLITISTMGTKLPWYVLPVYPGIALAGGAQLAEVCNWPSSQSYPRFWAPSLTVMSLLALGGGLYYGGLGSKPDWYLLLVLGAAALTFLVSAVLVSRRDLQFMSILFWGSYISLLVFMASPHWVWELNEAYPVKPVAQIIEQGTPTGVTVYTSFDYGRPSLNFYSNHQIIAAPIAELQQNWLKQHPNANPVTRPSDSELRQDWLKERWKQEPQPYLLLDQPTFNQLQLEEVKGINKAEGWLLLTKGSATNKVKSQKGLKTAVLKKTSSV